MLKVENLTIKHQQKILVNNLSFNIGVGDIYALVGASGSGKSLTALSITDLLPNTLTKTGRISYADKTNLTQLRGNEIGFVFQDSNSSLNAVFTIGYQLVETLKQHQKISQKQAIHQAKNYLDQVGLTPDLFPRYSHELSGGQKQRVMIALSLIAGAKLLLADEPTTALDKDIQAQILSLLNRLKQQFNLSILLITHDLALVKNIATRVGVMRNGSLVAEDNLAKILHHKDSYIKALLLGLTGKAPPSPSSDKLLIVKQINFYFKIKKRFFWQKRKKVHIFNNLSFNLYQNQNLAIVGPSGSGKTTLAKIITKQLTPTSGKVLFAGSDIQMISQRTYATKVQIIFQNVLSSFNPRQTIKAALLEGMQTVGVAGNHLTILQELFSEVDLDSTLMGRFAHQLSGGQLQRVCIVRALSVKPKIIICDEPTSALDNILKKQVLDLLLKLQQIHQISYIIITHDSSVVNYFANQILTLK